ncbi:ATPase, T2SS/T4P/T4SS family (plasmid) [Pseudomonas silesiensis]|mgnify:CR=1 FL=1|uniref:ATPase, T2SS/T4P/T4SS family n=1 Tax=Pseudomonas silesiensis TaxID=1853130 RepID=UPI0030D5CB26
MDSSSSVKPDQKLFDLDEITDFILPGDHPAQGIFYPGTRFLQPHMVGLANALVDAAKKNKLVNSTVVYQGRTFRCHVMPTHSGDRYILRRMPNKIMSLMECGLPKVITRELLSPRLLKGGLIIVAGLPGNGKSTTLGSIVVDRLVKFGGICITVEDPVEMPLDGFHGNGYCIQRSITGEEALGGAIKDALRAYPAKTNAMMMIGEIRDSQAAALALRSAVDGRLVMLTMHAGSVVQSLIRLCSMAAREMALEEVRELLASSFRMAMHQSLLKDPSTGRVQMKVSVLMDTLQVCGTIKQRNVSLENLKNDLLHQQNLFRNNQPIELRPAE